MSLQAATLAKTASPAFTPVPSGLLQRKCAACGTHTPGGGTCGACGGKDKGLKLQKKLSIGASNDPLEAEADRVADQVLAKPATPAIGDAPPRIQRLSSQSEPESDAAPDSVHRTLGSSGAPLDTSVRHDMEARFGQDFSSVRVHTDGPAARSASDVDARAYTVGSNVVFGAGQYAPGSAAGQRLLAHELTHVVQQGEAIIQRTCTSAATCSAPIPGDPTDFGVSEEANEKPFLDRRQRMTPTRARSTGHAGRAKQLEKVLEGHDPTLKAQIHGIFVHQDLSSGTEALKANCANWRADSLPVGDSDPDGFAGATKSCVFIHGTLNQEALKFNSGDTSVGGRTRDVWKADTIETLAHEVQHEIFDTAIEPTLPTPGGITTPGCTKSNVAGKLSEIAAMLSGFPLRFKSAQTEADPRGPAHVALVGYFDFIMTGGESIPGALAGMGCKCECPEVSAFVRQAVDKSTAGFTAAEKTALRTELQTRMPGPVQPIWPATPP